MLALHQNHQELQQYQWNFILHEWLPNIRSNKNLNTTIGKKKDGLLISIPTIEKKMQSDSELYMISMWSELYQKLYNHAQNEPWESLEL